jgi:hypothetical protein
MKKNYLFLAVLALITMGSCTCKEKDNTLTKEEKAEGWKLLFDGETTNGWRGYNSAEIPAAWTATDGTLMSAGEGGDIGGDIITTDKYANFHLKLDWKLSPEGNSGVMYHVVEAPELASTYYSGPEYQIIDDIGFPGGVTPYNSTGADYAMTPADTTQKVLHPVGEWNTSEIIFDNGKVTHFLNGNKIVEFTAWTEEWKANVAKAKWSKYPAYGQAKTGFIALQDHGSYIWFKNIKVKEL